MRSVYKSLRVGPTLEEKMYVLFDPLVFKQYHEINVFTFISIILSGLFYVLTLLLLLHFSQKLL